MIKQPLLKRKKIKRPGFRFFSFIWGTNESYEGGNGEKTAEQYLKEAEKVICFYLLIGTIYYTIYGFNQKGISPFAAQLLAAAVSFCSDEYIDHLLQGKDKDGSQTKSIEWANRISAYFALTLGFFSMGYCYGSPEQSPTEYANSTITILNGIINYWQYAMTDQRETFEYWNPKTLATEFLFQIAIMVYCLCKSDYEIDNTDKIAIFYTILTALDSFLDIISDLCIEAFKHREKCIYCFKFFQNLAMCFFGFYLWTIAKQDWEKNNGEEYKSLQQMTNYTTWFEEPAEPGFYCNIQKSRQLSYYFYLREKPISFCSEYLLDEQKFPEVNFGWFSQSQETCSEQCPSSQGFYTKAYKCNPKQCSLSYIDTKYWMSETIKMSSNEKKLDQDIFDNWEMYFLFQFFICMNFAQSLISLVQCLFVDEDLKQLAAMGVWKLMYYGCIYIFFDIFLFILNLLVMYGFLLLFGACLFCCWFWPMIIGIYKYRNRNK